MTRKMARRLMRLDRAGMVVVWTITGGLYAFLVYCFWLWRQAKG